MAENFQNEVVELVGEDQEIIIDSDDIITVLESVNDGETPLPSGLTFEQYSDVVLHFLSTLYDLGLDGAEDEEA